MPITATVGGSASARTITISGTADSNGSIKVTIPSGVYKARSGSWGGDVNLKQLPRSKTVSIIKGDSAIYVANKVVAAINDIEYESGRLYHTIFARASGTTVYIKGATHAQAAANDPSNANLTDDTKIGGSFNVDTNGWNNWYNLFSCTVSGGTDIATEFNIHYESDLNAGGANFKFITTQLTWPGDNAMKLAEAIKREWSTLKSDGYVHSRAPNTPTIVNGEYTGTGQPPSGRIYVSNLSGYAKVYFQCTRPIKSSSTGFQSCEDRAASQVEWGKPVVVVTGTDPITATLPLSTLNRSGYYPAKSAQVSFTGLGGPAVKVAISGPINSFRDLRNKFIAKVASTHTLIKGATASGSTSVEITLDAVKTIILDTANTHTTHADINLNVPTSWKNQRELRLTLRSGTGSGSTTSVTIKDTSTDPAGKIATAISAKSGYTGTRRSISRVSIATTNHGILSAALASGYPKPYVTDAVNMPSLAGAKVWSATINPGGTQTYSTPQGNIDTIGTHLAAKLQARSNVRSATYNSSRNTINITYASSVTSRPTKPTISYKLVYTTTVTVPSTASKYPVAKAVWDIPGAATRSVTRTPGPTPWADPAAVARDAGTNGHLDSDSRVYDVIASGANVEFIFTAAVTSQPATPSVVLTQAGYDATFTVNIPAADFPAKQVSCSFAQGGNPRSLTATGSFADNQEAARALATKIDALPTVSATASGANIKVTGPYAEGDFTAFGATGIHEDATSTISPAFTRVQGEDRFPAKEVGVTIKIAGADVSFTTNNGGTPMNTVAEALSALATEIAKNTDITTATATATNIKLVGPWDASYSTAADKLTASAWEAHHVDWSTQLDVALSQHSPPFAEVYANLEVHVPSEASSKILKFPATQTTITGGSGSNGAAASFAEAAQFLTDQINAVTGTTKISASVSGTVITITADGDDLALMGKSSVTTKPPVLLVHTDFALTSDLTRGVSPVSEIAAAKLTLTASAGAQAGTPLEFTVPTVAAGYADGQALSDAMVTQLATQTTFIRHDPSDSPVANADGSVSYTVAGPFSPDTVGTDIELTPTGKTHTIDLSSQPFPSATVSVTIEYNDDDLPTGTATTTAFSVGTPNAPIASSYADAAAAATALAAEIDTDASLSASATGSVVTVTIPAAWSLGDQGDLAVTQPRGFDATISPITAAEIPTDRVEASLTIDGQSYTLVGTPTAPAIGFTDVASAMAALLADAQTQLGSVVNSVTATAGNTITISVGGRQTVDGGKVAKTVASTATRLPDRTYTLDVCGLSMPVDQASVGLMVSTVGLEQTATANSGTHSGSYATAEEVAADLATAIASLTDIQSAQVDPAGSCTIAYTVLATTDVQIGTPLTPTHPAPTSLQVDLSGITRYPVYGVKWNIAVDSTDQTLQVQGPFRSESELAAGLATALGGMSQVFSTNYGGAGSVTVNHYGPVFGFTLADSGSEIIPFPPEDGTRSMRVRLGDMQEGGAIHTLVNDWTLRADMNVAESPSTLFPHSPDTREDLSWLEQDVAKERKRPEPKSPLTMATAATWSPKKP